MGRPHVVILGAGASIASTIHNPERSGKKLPSMKDFIDVVGLSDIIRSVEPGPIESNFEALCSRLYSQEPTSPVIDSIERKVREYFQNLELPLSPTIYDYLVLSLRPKDLIATFNWDPLLFQAFCRNRSAADPPRLSFLHGNVAIGFSSEDQAAGPAGMILKQTGHQFIPTPLLYPVTRKDYSTNAFIRREWNRLERCLKEANRLTIFGFGAPSTDVEAVRIMSEAWGNPLRRDLEQVEMIDILPRDVVRNRWAKFICTHHYDYCKSYFESVLARFPRRTGEAFMHQFLPTTLDEAFQEPNPVPERFNTLEEMWDWHQPLVDAERSRECGA